MFQMQYRFICLVKNMRYDIAEILHSYQLFRLSLRTLYIYNKDFYAVKCETLC